MICRKNSGIPYICNMNKALEINTVSVSIKVVSVDGKRLTKAVFNQIQEMWPFDENLFCIGEVLGYVVDGQWHLLWVFEGELRRYALGAVRQFASSPLPNEKNNVGYVSSRFVRSLGHIPDTVGRFSSEDIAAMNIHQLQLSAFLINLTGKQLYIAI